jgi:SpoVK/Ycf46/Vps4 family AAA+-type ATPase
MEKLRNLLHSRMSTFIFADTSDHDSFISDVVEMMRSDPVYKDYKLLLWNAAKGIRVYNDSSEIFERIADERLYKMTLMINGLADYIHKMQSTEDYGYNSGKCVFLLDNIDMTAGGTPVTIQSLLDTRQLYRSLCPVIMTGNLFNLPKQLKSVVTSFSYDLPDKKELKDVFIQFRESMKTANTMHAEKGNDGSLLEIPTDDDLKELVSAAQGLTYENIKNCSQLSIREHKKLDIDMIQKYKIQVIKESGCLDYIDTSHINIKDMGGNEVFKDWVQEVELSSTEEAEQFGVEPAKGFVAFGPAGTGKSFSASICASLFHVPLIELNFSKIMGSLVGQSEQTIDRALSIVKAVSPCVLLIDECEKSLGGYKSSAQSDSGTLSRVLGRILSFMQQEDTHVFVVMTSNDISKLPPELMRSGRLDTHWYFGIPTRAERNTILNIHLKKKKINDISDSIRKSILDQTDHFTGAEMKTFVNNLMRKTWLSYCKTGNKEITDKNITNAAQEIVPVYKSAQDLILGLQTYAEQHARFASESSRNISKVSSGLNLDISL